MAKPPYKFLYLLVCDDVRREDNRKELLIGVYNNNEIVFPSLPGIMPTFAIRVCIFPMKREFKDVQIRIKDPSGKEIFSAAAPVDFGDQINKPAALVFNRIPSPFMVAGAHKVLFGMDEMPQKIGEIIIVDSSAKVIAPKA